MTEQNINQDENEQKPSIKPFETEDLADKKGKKSIGREILEWIVTLAVAVVLALTIRTFLFEPIRVDGSSMKNTLQDGEFMIVTKPEYLLGDPQRFDVVICRYPDRTENFVKRLVGLPGDTIGVANGEAQHEDYIDYPPRYSGEWTLGEGEYFVMGDNRASSNDSHLIGPITRDMIVGHVQLVVWPIAGFRLVR
ncbi:MAG TPA: signal peptidase I [Clostridia bacterium]|nr:signal peptidase I [Clostridia bacterium]